MNASTNYTVSNRYGIRGTSSHRTADAALRAADRREGDGWEVHDGDGNRWDWYAERPVITEYSDNE